MLIEVDHVKLVFLLKKIDTLYTTQTTFFRLELNIFTVTTTINLNNKMIRLNLTFLFIGVFFFFENLI